MTHTHPAIAHPVTRCTAFAAVVAIGALGMSAPAAASPVSTTTPDTAPVVTEQTSNMSHSAEALVALTDDAQLDKKSKKVLSRAAAALDEAEKLTSDSKVSGKRADKIAEAAADVRSIVTAAAEAHEATSTRAATQAAGERTERASRSATRPEVPTAASAPVTAAVADATRKAKSSDDTEADPALAADDLSAATKSLSGLLKKADSDKASKVSPKSAKKKSTKKQAEESRDEKPSRGESRSAPKKSAPKAKMVGDLSGAVQQHGNGQIPAKLLCDLSFASDQLRCDAAFRAEKLNEAFRDAFGRDLQVNDAYRSYPDQVAIKKSHGNLAAPPGTSNHGWGQALDLGGGIEAFGSDEHEWMKANAGEFGWHHPAWAEPTGSKPEAWHWEYAAG